MEEIVSGIRPKPGPRTTGLPRAFALEENRGMRLFSLAISILFVYSQAWAAPLHIMIDPGHGGVDSGATKAGLKEKDIALKVSNRLAEKLRGDSRFKVSLTRTSDKKVSLRKRVQSAQDQRADIFMSIHLNSSKDPRARGTEFYFQNQLPADEEALYLVSREHEEGEEEDAFQAPDAQKAEPISVKTDLKRIIEDLHRNNRIRTSSEFGRTLLETWLDAEAPQNSHRTGSRAIRQAPFHVVSYIQIPSVLVEIGYISHPEEGPLLARSDYQDKLATSLYDGLVKFKETMDNNRDATLKSQANPTLVQ